MKMLETKKQYALISAIIYVVLALYYAIRIIRYGVSIYLLIQVISLFGLAGTLFIKNRKAVIFSASGRALFAVYGIIRFSTTLLSCVYGFLLLAYVATVIIILMEINGYSFVKKTWFLPGALCLLVGSGCSLEFVDMGIIGIGTIAEGIALVFVGLWLNDNVVLVPEVTLNVNETHTPKAYSSAMLSNNAIGGADKLKVFKELLDSGAITQEEFDAKKKEILGL